MEAVRAFNNELSSLYEGRPPVSRAKMAQVTKCAIKAIKFYKHVVQSVEKFIQKCKPEYKVPGLYVIDSIVRQSRHQFGPEKDVFSPRFTKNIVNTFTNLFKCPVEERSRVVRVLNLWQKNSVFPVEVIQPLLDLAADPTNSDLVTAAQRSVDAVVSVTQKVPLPGTQSSSNGGDSSNNQLLQQKDMLSTITKLLQQAQDGSITGAAPESQLQQLQHLQQQLVMQTERISKPQQSTPPIDSNLLAQIQMLTSQLLSKTGGGDGSGDNGGRDMKTTQPGFNKKLLDFDYGESDDEEDRQDFHHQSHGQPMPQGGLPAMLQNSNLVQQIQQMSQQQEELQSEIGAQDQLRRRLLEQQQQQFDREIEESAMMGQNAPDMMMQPDRVREPEQDDDRENTDRGDRRRNRSRDRSRSPRRRRRSRSRSRDRRRRSRSRDRHRSRRSRSRERENSRREREKERERRKKGLPMVKENCISVCTTTLWFGHLTKHTTEEELREHIEKYGVIKTINMIPPRGCAFVCLTKRKDAFKALDRLKGVKVNGNSLKVAWAPGIGVKESMFKDLWDVDQGVTYIPWDQLPQDISPILGGGMVDEDSLPPRLKGMKSGEEDENDQPSAEDSMRANKELGMPSHNQLQQQQQQQPPQQMMNMPRPPNFPGMPGQMGMVGPPMGMMGGPPGMDIRLPSPMSGPQGMNAGPPNMSSGSSNMDNSGPSNMNTGLPGMNSGPPGMNSGPPGMNSMNSGPPGMNSGPPGMNSGPPGMNSGLPGMSGPRGMNSGPPGMNNGPPGMNSGPPGMNSGPPGMNSAPPGLAALANLGAGIRAGLQGLQQRSDNDMGPLGGGMMSRGQMPGSPMSGNQMGGPQVSRSPMGQLQRNPLGSLARMDSIIGQLRMNSSNVSRPFPPFPRFPPLQSVGGMRPPFFNNNSNNDGPDQMGDSDMRAAETKEWPPDDEVNAEDEEPDEDPMDSDERLPPRLPPGMPSLRSLGNPLRPGGPMMQSPGNPMLAAIPRAQSPNTGMLSLRMMPPAQQPPVIAMPGGPGAAAAAAGFALAQGIARAGMRIPMPNMGVRSGLVPAGPSQRLLPPSSVPVSVNGSVVVPAVAVSVALSTGGRTSPAHSPSPDVPPVSLAPKSESPLGNPSSRPGGPIPLMQVQGPGQSSPGTPILGRGFSPMTIRPRGGPGLLGLRPGAQGSGGFNRFGGPRSLLGPGFGNFERPSFGGRLGAPLRPPLPGFFEEDKDERVLRKLDIDERKGPGDRDERGARKDIDERRLSSGSNPAAGAPGLLGQKPETEETTKTVNRASGRPSRWSDAPVSEPGPIVKPPDQTREEPKVSEPPAAPIEAKAPGDGNEPVSETPSEEAKDSSTTSNLPALPAEASTDVSEPRTSVSEPGPDLESAPAPEASVDSTAVEEPDNDKGKEEESNQ